MRVSAATRILVIVLCRSCAYRDPPRWRPQLRCCPTRHIFSSNSLTRKLRKPLCWNAYTRPRIIIWRSASWSRRIRIHKRMPPGHWTTATWSSTARLTPSRWWKTRFTSFKRYLYPAHSLEFRCRQTHPAVAPGRQEPRPTNKRESRGKSTKRPTSGPWEAGGRPGLRPIRVLD
jgi:hypothetical protein